MIRQAEPEDMERILEMGLRFASETAYKDLIDVKAERVSAAIVEIASSHDGAILLSEASDHVNGMIAVMIYDHPFSGDRTAFEIVWWVDPEARGQGVRLLHEAEKWAREQGAMKMQMVAPNEQVASLYRRVGYLPVETSFQRDL